MAAEKEFPKVDGDIFYSSEANYFNKKIWNTLNYTGGGNTILIAHSATTWTNIDGASTIRTTDTGSTWSAATTDNANMTGVSRVCAADKTKAICCDHNSGSVYYSTDSGDNWTLATTTLPSTHVADLSFPTTGVAIAVIDISATATSTYRSTDGGDNWTVATTGSDQPMATVSMLDGTTGFSVESGGGEIWKTTDGGVNWTDTTHTVAGSNDNGSSMVTLSSTSCIILRDSGVYKYEGSANATKKLDLKTDDAWRSNIIESTNGYQYFIEYHIDAANYGVTTTLYRSKDDGDTWQLRIIGNNSYTALTELSDEDTKSQLTEYDTDKMIAVIGGTNIILIDEADGF